MFEKITQIIEYWRLKKEYKIKEKEFGYLCLDECAAHGKIRSKQKSAERVVAHSIDKGLFGSYNYPCIVEKLGCVMDMGTLQLKVMFPILGPDETFYCPKYDKDENRPCDDTTCMHYAANQEYFLTKKNSIKAWEELKKIRIARDAAKNRVFNREK